MAQGLLLALFLLLIVRADVIGDFARLLEDTSLDFACALREPRSSRQVALLCVDEATVRRWNGRTFDAKDVAFVLRALRQSGARAVALDLPLLCDQRLAFPERAALVAAMRANGRVVLPLELRRATNAPPALSPPLRRFALSPLDLPRDEGAAPGSFALRSPAPDLLGAAAGAGHLSFEFDRFGRARRLPLRLRLGQSALPSLSLAVARLAGEAPSALASLPLLYPRGAFDGDVPAPPFRRISLATALADPRRLGELSGQTVVIGVTAPGMCARFPTPGGGRATESELMALSLDQLLAGAPLRRAPLLFQWLLALLPCLVVGGLGARYRLGSGALVALLSAFGVALVSFGFFLRDVWLPPSVAWLAIGATCVLNVAGQVRRRERESVSIASTVEALAQVAEIVAVGKTPDELLGRVVSFAAARLRASGAGAFLLDEMSGELRVAAALGPDAGVFVGQRLRFGEGVAGHVVSHGEPLLLHEAAGDESSRFDAFAGRETPSLLAVPLKGRGSVVGALEVVRPAGEAPFTQADLELLGAIANQAAVALDNVRLYDRLAFRVEQSQDALALANRELQADKTLLQTVLNSMNDGVVVTDECGRIQLINPAAGELFPALNNSALNWPLAIVLPDFGPAVAARTGDATQSPVVTLFRGSPEAPRAIEGYVAPLRGQKNELAGLVAVFSDVTQRREIEQAKSDFVSFVAHEMRSPLTSISGFSAMLQRGETGSSTLPPGTRARFLGLIHGESERLTRLINTLLDAARLEAGHAIELNRDSVELGALITLTLDNQRAYSSRHQLRADVPDDLPCVYADADKVMQILVNLLSNAQKYSPGGEVVVSAQARADEVEVSVCDQGPGIAPQQRALLFSRFGRAPSAAQGVGAGAKPTGTGLGLFLTKHLVEAHGGAIWVESEPGQGATFRFTLPREDKPQDEGEN